jgi:hypothetical protein
MGAGLFLAFGLGRVKIIGLYLCARVGFHLNLLPFTLLIDTGNGRLTEYCISHSTLRYRCNTSQYNTIHYTAPGTAAHMMGTAEV